MAKDGYMLNDMNSDYAEKHARSIVESQTEPAITRKSIRESVLAILDSYYDGDKPTFDMANWKLILKPSKYRKFMSELESFFDIVIDRNDLTSGEEIVDHIFYNGNTSAVARMADSISNILLMLQDFDIVSHSFDVAYAKCRDALIEYEKTT